MDARLFTIPASKPHRSEKTFILYWNTGLNQFNPIEFLNRSKTGLLVAGKDCVHRTLEGVGRAEPIRKNHAMNGFPYIVEVNLPLGETISLMRAGNFNRFAKQVSKVHPYYSQGGNRAATDVTFADNRFALKNHHLSYRR